MPSCRLIVGDVLDKLADLPERSVHCCMTSPPYWGLRDYKVDGQLGLEPTIDEYVTKMVEVFGAVRRVLRDDGCLFVNMGDCYSAASTHGGGGKVGPMDSQATTKADRQYRSDGLAAGNLCNIPARFSLAMQDDSWILRSTIIWAKGLSFCDEYAGSVMPESVQGWRWEQHRIKVRASERETRGQHVAAQAGMNNSHAKRDGPNFADQSDRFVDCPGCDRCLENGGLVLRKGSWRPTSAYEFVFMFAKTSDYFCDGEAVREAHHDAAGNDRFTGKCGIGDRSTNSGWHGGDVSLDKHREYNPAGRNLRNVWVINPQPFPDAHFATFPEKLVEPIIKAATSDKGVCPECGAPWARVIESTQLKRERPNDRTSRHLAGDGVNSCGNTVAGVDVRTLGWRPTCGCGVIAGLGPGRMPFDAVPAQVLDPFVGSGTTLLVARKLGRDSIGIELSPEYAHMAEKRVADYAPLFTETVEGDA